MIPHHRDVCAISTLQQRRNKGRAQATSLSMVELGSSLSWSSGHREEDSVQACAPACFIKPLTHGQVVFITCPHPARAQQGAEHRPITNLASENFEQAREQCLTLV